MRDLNEHGVRHLKMFWQNQIWIIFVALASFFQAMELLPLLQKHVEVVHLKESVCGWVCVSVCLEREREREKECVCECECECECVCVCV